MVLQHSPVAYNLYTVGDVLALKNQCSISGPTYFNWNYSKHTKYARFTVSVLALYT